MDAAAALDELRLAAAMLRRFGDATTPRQASDIAERLDRSIKALEAVDAAGPGHGPRTSPKWHAAPAAPPRAGNHGAQSRRGSLASESPRRLSGISARSPAVPGSAADSPALPRIRSPRAPPLTARTEGSLRLGRPAQQLPGSATGLGEKLSVGQPQAPPREAITKVTAGTLSQWNEAASATGRSGGERRETHLSVGAAVFLVLEASMTMLQAEAGAVYVPFAHEEMVSIATIHPSLPTYPPPLVKHLLAGSVTGSVLSSGIAVHQRGPGLDDNNRRVPGQLLLPVIAKDGQRIGVLQLSGKYRGAVHFSEADEAAAHGVAQLLAALLTRYPIVWSGPAYDPVALHKSSPWVPPAVDAAIYGTIPDEMRDREVAPLIHRSGGAMSLAKRVALADDAAALSGAPTLREVDCYIDNLQDCWRRSVQMNIEHGQREHTRVSQLRTMREQLRTAQEEARRMSERMRLEHLDVSDYRTEYSTLKEELDRFLERKKSFDD